MWRLAGRTAGVFLFWGVLMLLATEAGVPASTSELLAACGAALTFVLWGRMIRREERRIEAAASLSLDDRSRERATP